MANSWNNLMDTPSDRKLEANRRNAQKSTGPKTPEGKERSRRNALKHGFSSQVVLPDQDRPAFEATLDRWNREAGPDNVVEEHLIRRAAVGSVILDRLDEARERSRQEVAREAVRRWEEKQRHRARRKAQDLSKDPFNIVNDLEATAFGCDWLMRQWLALDSELSIGKSWDQRAVIRVQALLGYPEAVPTIDADPTARLLWILAAALSPRSVTPLPRLEDEADLPTDPVLAREQLRAFITEQLDRLEGLREESWEAVEGPSRDAVVAQAVAADPSPEGDRHHRYARDADRSASAAVRLFLNIRDRRRREYLVISKEAARNDLPRVPVGNGWWREVDSGPAPPGFCRIGSTIKAAAAEPSAEAIADPFTGPSAPEPSPSPRNGPDQAEVSSLASRTMRPGAPGRNEPNVPASNPTFPASNPRSFNDLRNLPADTNPGAPGRTGPFPSPSNPPGIARPTGPSTPDQRRGPDTTSSPTPETPGE
jgi:hypothetical protein